jgi:hypothetical protein
MSSHQVTGCGINIHGRVTSRGRIVCHEIYAVVGPHPTSVSPGIMGSSGIPRNFVWGGSSKDSVEDRGQSEQGSGDGSPVVRGSARFANE